MVLDATTVQPRHRQPASGRALSSPPPERLLGFIRNAEAALAEPFRGVTTDGQSVPDLFPIRPTGVPTTPIRQAVEAFLAALEGEQAARASFPVDGDAWRRWSNIHPFVMRHGLSLEELAPAQRERAFAVLAETLSDHGYRTARDVMRLNHTIGELTGRWDEYCELLYWLSVMGTPSESEPWGWQIDGHHLIVNAFVLGDQLVTTPTFMGSEPVRARSGTYAGTRVFEAEERDGLALMRSLPSEQRQAATIGDKLPGDVFGTGFHDNVILPAAGVPYASLAAGQRDRLHELIELYVGRTRPDHAAVKMAEVRAHLDETRFAWIGGCEEDSVFYYRVQSPVVLIEFDHQSGVALDHDGPFRDHIHTVVRTPNGNDYGRDLLRQHYAQHDHAHPHSHHLGGPG
jgi:hypothetical protein